MYVVIKYIGYYAICHNILLNAWLTRIIYHNIGWELTVEIYNVIYQ